MFDYLADAECGALAGVALKNGVRSIHPTVGDCIRFDAIVRDGKMIQPVVRLAGKTLIVAAWDAYDAGRRAHWDAEEASLEAAVPGLRELTTAISSQERYDDQLARMMESESNDGARPPVRPSGRSPAVIAAEYPRAAMYVRAEDYAVAAHDAKAEAGDRAMRMLRDGADLAAVAAVLDNWLPASAFDN